MQENRRLLTEKTSYIRNSKGHPVIYNILSTNILEDIDFTFQNPKLTQVALPFTQSATSKIPCHSPIPTILTQRHKAFYLMCILWPKITNRSSKTVFLHLSRDIAFIWNHKTSTSSALTWFQLSKKHLIKLT